ncbi:MAG: conserved rane protein of unknown function [Solirubrobacterales bacterium]|nr:conserved rane protein of unknown function [Solirubrobacterales bacterium]
MSAPPTQATPDAKAERRGLLGWIAAERALRTLLLLGVGIVLLTHPHTDWAGEITHLTRALGLDPNGNWVQRIVRKVRSITPHENTVFGVVALAYAVLEGTEAYGLWRRRRWGEWLTVLATSLLLVPEIWELTKSVTPLKLGGLIVNLLVVAYLLWRLRRTAAERGA